MLAETLAEKGRPGGGMTLFLPSGIGIDGIGTQPLIEHPVRHRATDLSHPGIEGTRDGHAHRAHKKTTRPRSERVVVIQADAIRPSSVARSG